MFQYDKVCHGMTRYDNLKIIGKNIIVPKSSSNYFDYYTIKKGDSLYKIASKYGVEYNLLALSW